MTLPHDIAYRQSVAFRSKLIGGPVQAIKILEKDLHSLGTVSKEACILRQKHYDNVLNETVKKVCQSIGNILLASIWKPKSAEITRNIRMDILFQIQDGLLGHRESLIYEALELSLISNNNDPKYRELLSDIVDIDTDLRALDQLLSSP